MAVDIVVKNKINIGYKSSMSNQIKLIIIENTIYYEKEIIADIIKSTS